jgi:hypothetical protein
VVSGTAGFDTNGARMKIGEKFDHGPPVRFSVADFPTLFVSRENLKNVLGNVQTHIVCFFHGPPPYLALLDG